MNVKNTQGFTLIELMIVVAIIAILAAIALPAYQDYTIRSQVSEGMVLGDGAKTAVAEFFTNKGTFPASNVSAGLAAATSIKGKYVTGVAVAAGKITATYGNEANSNISGKIINLSPVAAATDGSIVWTCKTGNTVAQKYLPTACR